MAAVRRTLKWGFISVLSLLVVLIAAWALSRALYPTEAQQEAIAEMEQLPEFEGENAFALLWTLDRAVPEDELANVMAEDVRQALERPGFPDDDATKTWNFDSAADRYPDLSLSTEDRELICSDSEEGCLAKVRNDLDAYSALLDRNRTLFDRIAGLAEYEYLRSEFPHRMNTPLPNYGPASYLRTRHAVRFAQGQVREALAGTCRAMATWRRLGTHSDTLLARMVGVAYSTDTYGRSLANMVAELPVDTPLPRACNQALAPPTLADVSLCHAMKGEFALAADFGRNLSSHIEQDAYLKRLAWAVLYDAEATLGMTAEIHRSLCSESEGERLRADQRERPDPAPRSSWRFACLGNPIGCTTNAVSTPAFMSYRFRLQDYGAKLRVLGTLAWMRRHVGDGRSPADLLAGRPDDLKSPARDIMFGPNGQTLRVPLYNATRGEHWSIPLPSELHSSPRTGT